MAELLAGRRALPARSGAGTGELFAPPKPRTYVLPPLDAAPLTDAFDEWELLGFPLCSPFLLLTEDAKAIVRSGVLARDLPDRIGDVVTVVGHLVTVKETATAKGERMCFGCFIDLEGAWLDTVHFPDVARDFRFEVGGCTPCAAPSLNRLGASTSTRNAWSVWPRCQTRAMRKTASSPRGWTAASQESGANLPKAPSPRDSMERFVPLPYLEACACASLLMRH